MELRDKRILWHIGLHGISIREVIEHLFFDGKGCGNVLQRLRNDGLIEEAARLPGNFTCYSLTRKAEAGLGLPASPRKRGAQAVGDALGALWFCHIEAVKGEHCRNGHPKQRWRSGPPRQPTRRLAELFPNGRPSGAVHCLEAAGTESRVYRIYVPRPKTPLQRVLRDIEKKVETTLENPHTRPWVAKRVYCLAVLLDNCERQLKVKKGVRGGGLHNSAYVPVEFAPSSDGLKEAIDALQP